MYGETLGERQLLGVKFLYSGAVSALVSYCQNVFSGRVSYNVADMLTSV